MQDFCSTILATKTQNRKATVVFGSSFAPSCIRGKLKTKRVFQNISKNIDELSKDVAEWMVEYINEVLQKQDRFTIALSGGSTPKKLYQLLASDQFKNKIDWQKLHIFWGDERYVPFEDERNNARMAFDTLLN